MPRNGSGVYALPNPPFVNGTQISESVMNGNFDDVVTALTNSLAKDGQTTPTANLPMGSYKLTGLGAGSADTDSVNFKQVQDERAKGSTAVTPYDHGADLTDGLGDDQQAAVQAALDEVAASWNEAIQDFEKEFSGAGRTWNVASGVYVENLRQPGMRISDAQFIGSGAGNTVLSMAGTNSPHLHNIWIFGDRSNPPHVGILTSRTLEASNYGISPNIEMFNVRTFGSYSGAGMASVANEVTSMLQCSIENDHKSDTALAYINVNSGAALSGKIGTVTCPGGSTLPSGAAQYSNIIHSYDQVRILRQARMNTIVLDISQTNPATVTVSSASLTNAPMANGDKVFFYNVAGPVGLNYNSYTITNLNISAGTFDLVGYDNSAGPSFVSGRVANKTGPAAVFSGAHQINIENGYGLTYGSPCLVFDMVNGAPPRSPRIHIQCEHSPRAPILIEHPATSVTWQGGHIHLSNDSQTNADCIVDDTGAGNINMHDVKLKVNNMAVAPAHGVLRNPGKFFFRDSEITVPLAAALNPASSLGASGVVLEAYDRLDARHDHRFTEHYRLKNEGSPVATVVLASSTDLADITHTINTQYKREGKMVFETDTNRILVAYGPNASAVWGDGQGNVIRTPA